MNIYTILEKIGYEDKIKSICRTTGSDEFLIQQGIFNILQEFHKEIVNVEVDRMAELEKLAFMRSTGEDILNYLEEIDQEQGTNYRDEYDLLAYGDE